MHEDIVTVAGKPFRRASWRRRVVGRLIDLVFLMLVNVASALVNEPLGVVSMILSGFYLLFGNGLLGGGSIGKRLTGQRVLETRHGGPCSWIQDGMRHKYLFFLSLPFLILLAYDSSQGCFDTPETYVVLAKPLTAAEMETLKEKPARLNLAGLHETMAKMGPKRHRG